MPIPKSEHTVDASQYSLFRSQLQTLLAELEEEISGLQEAAAPVTLDQQAFGRVSRGDALQQQNMAKANLALAEQRRLSVLRALAKIDSEDFGYCEACDEDIALPRLQARPDSALCISCQQQHEQL